VSAILGRAGGKSGLHRPAVQYIVLSGQVGLVTLRDRLERTPTVARSGRVRDTTRLHPCPDLPTLHNFCYVRIVQICNMLAGTCKIKDNSLSTRFYKASQISIFGEL
jgi:hypothetical protein